MWRKREVVVDSPVIHIFIVSLQDFRVYFDVIIELSVSNGVVNLLSLRQQMLKSIAMLFFLFAL